MPNQFQNRRLIAPRFLKPRPALFLDRDGVLIEEKHYLRNQDQVFLCPGVENLLENAFYQQLPVVVITNQSGVSRGYFSWQDYELVTERILQILGPKAPLAGIYANGYGPDSPVDSWRKPSPAMILAAASDLNLDLKNSILIGDRLSDLKAGIRAGLPLLAHVLTGHGPKERESVENWFSLSKNALVNNPCVELLLLNSLTDFHLPNSVLLNRYKLV